MPLDLKNLPPVDLYQLLAVSRDATTEEISKAYRRIALKTHPDKNSGNKKMLEIFKLSTCAYHILSNPRKRAEYDKMTKPSLIARMIPWINGSNHSSHYATNA